MIEKLKGLYVKNRINMFVFAMVALALIFMYFTADRGFRNMYGNIIQSVQKGNYSFVYPFTIINITMQKDYQFFRKTFDMDDFFADLKHFLHSIFLYAVFNLKKMS